LLIMILILVSYNLSCGNKGDVRLGHCGVAAHWGLVFILAGSLFYGTVTFRKKTRVLKYW
jgi:hypothetical protein